MRIHPAVLLVVVALTIPFVVELRTALVWVDVELTVAQTLAIGVLVNLLVVAWAVYPPRNGNGSEASG